MAPDHWENVNRVWDAVLERPERERSTALAELCGGDADVRREVESMLGHLARATAAGFGTAVHVERQRQSLLGRTLGPYRLQRLIGAGGMGLVYQAHDGTLGRDVAVKIIPAPAADDPAWQTQVDREARLLASLNHPNIGAIYGLHSADSVRALILELVDGDTLAELISGSAAKNGARRGLPVPDVRAIAAQVAEALAAAHERGVVHRDLKPSNIKVTPEMRVKVLDFGLALHATHQGDAEGILAGTPAYMSPEQASGRRVDRRTDVWAFGCVLYEMLTGVQAFGRDENAATLDAVLGDEPDWSLLPADTPAAFRMCLRRCLVKDAAQRMHDMTDVRLVMEGAFDQPAAAVRAPQRRMWALGAVALAAIAAAAAVAGSWRGGDARPPLEPRLQILTPDADDPLAFALSPDGRRLVFQAGAGSAQLWVRRLEAEEADPLAGTEGGIMPFWSHDGRSVGFFANGLLKRLDIADGRVRTLAVAPQPRRGAWNAAGDILFGASSVGPLLRVHADGGPVRQVTTLLPGQTNHRWPQFLPDGRRFLIFALGRPDVRGLYAGSLDDSRLRRVSDRESAYSFMPPSQLLLARQGGLWSRPLSSDLTAPAGNLVAVASKVLLASWYTGYAAFSASANGAIAYRASAGTRQLAWLDRAGRVVERVGPADDSQLTLTHLAPDGLSAGVQRNVDGVVDIWVVDTRRGVPRRLTFDGAFDGNVTFSPDGRRVAYVTDGTADVYQIHLRASDGTGDAVKLLESPENKNPSDWSLDGRFLLYDSQNPENHFDLWAVPMLGGGKPIEVARTPFTESNGRFSPDARWIAFQSSESGRSEVYVQRFPGSGPKTQVSVGGGWAPRWPRHGREIFYLAPGNRVMAVSPTFADDKVVSSEPRPLFVLPGSEQFGYELSGDGQRFLVSTPVSSASPITVILNWQPPAR